MNAGSRLAHRAAVLAGGDEGAQLAAPVDGELQARGAVPGAGRPQHGAAPLAQRPLEGHRLTGAGDHHRSVAARATVQRHAAPRLRLTEWTDTRRPTHLVFDGAGRAYVSELWWQPDQTSRRYGPAGSIRSGRVSVHDGNGGVIARWGGQDPTAAGSFAAPHGIAVDSRGDVYVSEVTWTFAASRGHVPPGTHAFQKFALAR